MPNGHRRRPVFTPKRPWRGKQLRFVRNRFIIRLRNPSKTEQELEAQLDVALEGIPVIKPYRFLGDVVVVDIRGGDDENADDELLARIDRLKTRPDVRFVEPDLRLSHLTLPIDERSGGPQDADNEQWGWLHIGMEGVWQTVTGTDDVVVAILDSALYEHVDLDTAGIEAAVNIEAPGTPVFSNLDLEAAHGTRVAGIITARADNNVGVSGMNTTSPLRYYRTDVPGEVATTASNLLEAVLDVIAEAGPRDRKAVINMSWAADLQDVATNTVQAEALETLGTLCDAVEESQAVLLCCGAGNHDGATQWPARFASDGVHTCVIAVGGTSLVVPPAPVPGDDPPPAERLAALTNGYANEYLWSLTPGDLNVTVVAPGDNLKVLAITPPEQVVANAGVDPRDRTDSWDGTSLAVGFAAGAASLVWSVHPTLSPAGVVRALSRSAIQADGLGKPASSWGHGRIDVARALDAVHPIPIVDAIMDLSIMDRRKLDIIAEMIKEWIDPFNPRFQMEVLGPDGRAVTGSLDRIITTADPGLLGTPVTLSQQISAAMDDIASRNKNPTLVPRPTGIVFVTNRNDHEAVSQEVSDRLAASGTRIHVIRDTALDGVSDALADLVAGTGGIKWSLDATKDMTIPRHESQAHLYEAAGWRILEGLSTSVELDARTASLAAIIPSNCTFVDFVATVPDSCEVLGRLSIDGRSIAQGDPAVQWITQKGLHIVRVMPRMYPEGEWRYDISVNHDDATAYGEGTGETTLPIAIMAAGNLPNTDVVID